MKTIQLLLLTLALGLTATEAQAQSSDFKVIVQPDNPSVSYHWGLLNSLDRKFQTDAEAEVFTTPEGETFTIEVIVADSVLALTNPKVETRGGPKILYKTDGVFAQELSCPDGFEATYVADETEQYQMGYCQANRALVHVNGTFGKGTVGADLDALELPFVVAYPASEERR